MYVLQNQNFSSETGFSIVKSENSTRFLITYIKYSQLGESIFGLFGFSDFYN
jgi:hypothetical protein